MAKKVVKKDGERKFGPYTDFDMLTMGHKYKELEGQIKILTEQKNELNEQFKMVLPMGKNTIIGDLLFVLEDRPRSNTDHKLVKNLVSEHMSIQLVNDIWAAATVKQSVPTLSVKKIDS